jgi:hypothetical protein
VKQGDLLVEIDPRSLQATVDQDKATIDRDRANLANAEADPKRYIPLAGGGGTDRGLGFHGFKRLKGDRPDVARQREINLR